MYLEAPGGDSVRCGGLESDQPIPPSVWQDGGRFADTLGVVPVGRVKHRGLADRSIDQIRLLLVHIVERHDVDLNGPLRRIRQLVGDGGIQSLATDDHQLVGAENAARGSNGVLELGAFQWLAFSDSAKCL